MQGDGSFLKGLHFWDMKTFFPASYEFAINFYWMEEWTDEYKKNYSRVLNNELN